MLMQMRGLGIDKKTVFPSQYSYLLLKYVMYLVCLLSQYILYLCLFPTDEGCVHGGELVRDN